MKGFSGANWSPKREKLVLRELLAFRPHITLVGLGMPLQESFAAYIVAHGVLGVVATIGGAIDQLTGNQLNAPRYLSKFGVERLWRLATQPKGLWRRYLLEPWQLFWLLLRFHARKPNKGGGE